MFTVESTDGGNSWGTMSLLDLPNPNSGVDAVTLADGRHLLVYNHAGRTKGKWDAGREVLNVAVSTDGKAWQAALVLENEAGQEFSYPAVDSNGRWVSPHHLHLEAQTDSTCRSRSCEAPTPSYCRWRVAEVGMPR